MMHKQGDIVLIPVPFTDLSNKKQRPVLIISNDDYNQMTDDVLVVAINMGTVPVFRYLIHSRETPEPSRCFLLVIKLNY
jgi:mRNA-degrading endonuclease toxin of MazEF toxin-antitoxin module